MLKLVSTLLAVATALGGIAAAPDAFPLLDGASPSVGAMATTGIRTVPPAPWAAADPADSLYRVAREALNRGDYHRAADMFARIHSRYPESEYAGDAMYWQAFALYRSGGTSDLRRAQRTLRSQKEKYPKAATRGDAETLEVRIAGQLARSGDAGSAQEVIKGADSAARSACRVSDDDDDPRVAALNALLHMNAEQAMPILRQVLARRDACSVVLRRKAVFLVSQKSTGDTEELLLSVARTDPDREVRSQAVFWMGQLSSERSTAALDSVLRSSVDPEIREQAVFALSQLSSARAAAILRGVAEDTSYTFVVRDKAIFWLGQRRSTENATFLRGLFDRTRSDELREKILFSLSQMRGVGSDKWLLEIAGEKKYGIDVRKQAVFSASQARAAIADVAALYDRLDDARVKEQTIFALTQYRDPAAVDKLISIAKTDRDPEMRKKAIFWLGQSHDPRVQQLLLDIING
jgi:HEAT repeat protein